MGTGKSTVGAILARRLSMPLIDTDHFIEQKLGSSISNLFKKKGEVFFRQQEYQLLLEISSWHPHVVCTGGGIVLNLKNREILRHAYWINLSAMPAVILRRIQNTNHRPLLESTLAISTQHAKKTNELKKSAMSHSVGGPATLGKKIKREGIESLLKERCLYYQMAPLQIDTSHLSPQAVSEIIFQKIHKHA